LELDGIYKLWQLPNTLKVPQNLLPQLPSALILAEPEMLLHYLALTYGTALVVGSPVPDLEPQLSEPLLIPTILGITDPMISNAPALPILQVPGPALPSIPFTGSNIKPKKIGYFWTGAGDNQYAGMQDHRVIPAVC
jgi:hypothetical protein